VCVCVCACVCVCVCYQPTCDSAYSVDVFADVAADVRAKAVPDQSDVRGFGPRVRLQGLDELND